MLRILRAYVRSHGHKVIGIHDHSHINSFQINE